MRNGILLVLGAAMALHGRGAAAQARELPELAQELFLAETVYPQGKGEVQLTAQSRLRHGAEARYLAEYGLTDRLQLAVLASQPGWEGEEEWAYEPELLYALLPAQTPVQLSVAVGAEIGAGEAPHWESTLIAAREWGRVQLHGSLAAELSQGENALSESAALLLDAGWLTPTLEAVWSSEEKPLLVPGVFVHPRRWAEVGIGEVLCASCAAPERGTHLVLTLEF